MTMRSWQALSLTPALAVCLTTTGALADPLPRFPASALWNQDVSAAPLHPQSAAMIATLAGLGGFGNGRMQIDFSFHVVHAPAGSPIWTTVALPGYYSPDCEPPGTSLPVPANAAIEGQPGLTCDQANNDCHLLVVADDTLYEVYRANAVSATQIETQCLAIWHLGSVYPPEGRGDHCTSADAAGFPIAPLLFNADEIAASLAIDPSGGGDVGHAIRFTLPNARMANDPSLGGLYVRPATHAGAPSGPVGSVPYGSRLRLRASFPLTGYNPAARVVLNSFKRYGIVLADGGSIALTAETDLYTTTKWLDLGIDSRVFDLTPGATDVAISDFEVVDTGARIVETYDCVRSCASLVASIARVHAVRDGAGGVTLTWDADAAAAGTNVWYVKAKDAIPLARQSSAPPANPVLNCVPKPAPSTICTDVGAVAREAPTLYFYQARSSCADSSEGP
jgi:serine/threonine-protein kinase